MNGKVTQEEINKVVWQACDTFRGVIDPSQYKDYILTMQIGRASCRERV